MVGLTKTGANWMREEPPHGPQPPPQRPTPKIGSSASNEIKQQGPDKENGTAPITTNVSDANKARDQATTPDLPPFFPRRDKERELAEFLAKNRNAKIRVKLSDDLVLKRDSQLVVSGGSASPQGGTSP